MKSKSILLALACSGALLFGLRGFALPAITGETSTEKAGETSAEKTAEMRAKLDKAEKNVRDRLHMSAMLEVTDDAGVEQNMAYLHRSGWIINATVEDVEAARKAAAATPSLDDDKIAEELAHRASCRFFYSE